MSAQSNTALVVIGILLIFILMNSPKNKPVSNDGNVAAAGEAVTKEDAKALPVSDVKNAPKQLPGPDPSTNGEVKESQKPLQAANEKGGACGSQFDGRWNSANLLPSETATKSDWALQTPSDLTDKNFLVSDQLDGLDTSGSSMRNANRQLRAEPVIPRVEVSPWNQSTIVRNDNYQVRTLDIL